MGSLSASPALVLAWSAVEPHRVGEVAFVPEGAKDVTFGRGRDDLMFVRQRPGSIALRPPLEGDGISRQQLRLRPSGEGLEIERIGRCPMLVNGERTDRVRVEAGDAVLLPSNVLFFVVNRPRVFRKLTEFSFSDMPRFGEIDRFGIVGESPAAWDLREAASRADRTAPAAPAASVETAAPVAAHAAPMADDLQSRREDVPLVMRHVLRDLARTNPNFLSRFITERGEVRIDGGLVASLLRGAIAHSMPHIERILWAAISESVDDTIAHSPEPRSFPTGPRSETLPIVDPTCERVREALESCHGSVAKAARLLGLRTRYELYRLLKKYKLEAIPRHDD
ncbi:helix-turn-helix domain-containing protein [Pendulispora albinea]|uniref:DNA binding HTH domain-containing protein n=1 Tax=Pendulispora albinea TaxID=2741071 RepID=A0ABZ2LUD5_9BACT